MKALGKCYFCGLNYTDKLRHLLTFCDHDKGNKEELFLELNLYGFLKNSIKTRKELPRTDLRENSTKKLAIEVDFLYWVKGDQKIATM